MGPGLMAISPLIKIVIMSPHRFVGFRMAAGQGGLILALLTLGFLLRFIPCKINFYDKSNIRVDDLGYYSSRDLNVLPKAK
jgi:hypothetical protein